MPYADPNALVSTEWLAAHLASPDIRIVDGSFKMPGVRPLAIEDYRERHIPGAVFFDINEIADDATPLPHMLPAPEKFSARVRKLGLGDGHRIIVYDSAGMMSAARIWWTFRAFGHGDIAILDGGLPKWLAEGRPVDDAVPAPRERHFTPHVNTMLVRDKQQMLENLASGREQVLDARAKARFEGAVEEPWPGRRRGRIPGSFNLPYDQLVDPARKTMLPAERLAELFDRAGIDRSRPVVTSCGSGVTACVLAFGLHLLGHRDVAVYDGSWAEWGLPGDTPVETGPARP
ncbi:MAG: 3-mercaptopyruvate sulfurtransferase [Alphaproteobacteria bacterium]|nr:3-mercaptopyruvate sulfurtransferase [Alphaproteobacteria bacterium]